MFVIERSTAAPVGSGGPKEEFAVLGATGQHLRTVALRACAQAALVKRHSRGRSRVKCEHWGAGNVYRVSIGMHPSCSCPDFRKGNVCKHVLFVMVRVIRLAPDDPLIWQKALLRSEV